MNKTFLTTEAFFFLWMFCSVQCMAQNHGNLLLRFHVMANNKALVLADSSYTNAFNESYNISRLKFYISNINTAGNQLKEYNKEIYLLENGITDSVWANVLPGAYHKLYFTVGVDSALNNSGAQEGVLDPLNGMFWTWNSGYIFFKMEGYSNASTADLQRIEHHIGGYRSPFNAARLIELNLPASLIVTEGSSSTIDIKLNLDNYWNGLHSIKIAEQALIMSPGNQASKIADNFQNMFSITSVH